ncbi:hypothetical protein MAMMFC1_03641 [Methylomusa anaerophila]|uniref:Uncharacterized protein n=1 Tax=Methylomusa anaerophila TaxID=1930071 RepID=A0A348APD5_9FIRM|nr:hypothetical protein MAMMFC1_03641 [Methylomusa anaerophila]
MEIITIKGYYFVGPIKHLKFHLENLCKQYNTIQEMINKNMH